MKEENSSFVIFMTVLLVAVAFLSFSFCSFSFLSDPKWHKSFRNNNEEEIINARYSKVTIEGHQYIEEYAMLGNTLSRTHCPDCKYCKK